MHSGRRKLLLADDSPTIRKVISLTFGDEGFEVVAVGDGAEALRALEEEGPPDVLLADVCMPGPDGYELCERVKRDARLRGIPVVLLVGTFEPFNEAEARRVGADTVLTKPFQSIRGLVSKVGSLLGGGPPREEDGAAAGLERARRDAPAEEPPREAHVREAEAPGAEPAFADLAADDELIEARPADAFAAASELPAAEGAHAFVESKDPDFLAEPHPGVNGAAAHASPAPEHEPAGFGANGRDAEPLTFEDEEERGPVAAAEGSINQSEETVMHEQTPPQHSFGAQAAGAAASDDALLDLGLVDTPATASAAEADDFVLDLGFEDEPAPPAAPQSFGVAARQEPAGAGHAEASARPDAPSAFAEAAHGEQPRPFNDAADPFAEPRQSFGEPQSSFQEQPLSFDEQPLSFDEQPLSFEEQPPALNEQQFSFAGSATSSAQAEPADSAPAGDAAWREVVMQDGPQGFAFESQPEAEVEGGAPRGFVEPEVVPADEPVPATVEGEFTDGSVEGDVPRPPAGQSASPFVGVAAGPASASPGLNAAHGVAQHEPSTASYAVGEARAGVEEPLRADQLSPEAVDAIARRVVELMSERVVREIAWEVVPELAELLIKRKLENQ